MLDQSILLLLQLRVFIDGLLDQELNVTELAEVEVPFPLEADHRLLEGCILLLQSGGSGAGSLGNTGTTAGSVSSTAGGGSGGRSGSRGTATGRESAAFSSGNGVVVVVGEVKVPEPLGPLQELEVVLHLALDES